MIAEVGDIEKVSGSRMATPFAPPRPGSTPMMTPSVMPTTITIRLNGWMATAKAVEQIDDLFHNLLSLLHNFRPTGRRFVWTCPFCLDMSFSQNRFPLLRDVL